MASQDRGSLCTAGLNLPALSLDGSKVQAKGLALPPPRTDLMQAGVPDRLRLVVREGEQFFQGGATEQTTFRMQVQGINAFSLINTPHDLAPDTSDLPWIGDTQAVKEHFVIGNAGGNTHQGIFTM